MQKSGDETRICELLSAVTGDVLGEQEIESQLIDVTLVYDDELSRVLKESEVIKSLLHESVGAMSQGLLIRNKDTILHANSRVGELLDIPQEYLRVGRTWHDFTHFATNRGDYGPDVTPEMAVAKICAEMEDGVSYTKIRQTPNGKWIRTDAQPRENGGAVVTYTDVTEDREREAELADAQEVALNADRAKSEFLANMSHEIRTPMNGVMGMAELLIATELDSKQKMFTDVIVKSGSALLTIINDILDFSKIDAGQMELHPDPFHLPEAIEDVATLVSAKVAEKDLELIVRIDPSLPKMLVGDVGRIRQIVTNLMGNAVKFTEKGHVFVNVDGVTTQGEDGPITSLKCSVEDTGIGIPKEQCDKVFQKFSQVDTSATRKHEGTGLGLSISSSLVELMGGEIGVESEVGHGTTFWFTIDLPVHGDEVVAPVQTGDFRDSTILIIDDNEVNRSILLEQMTSWKFDSASASSGPDGLKIVESAIRQGVDLDLIILDYQMPGMSGADVLKTLRSDATTQSIPVLMLTSVDSAQANQKLAKLGAEANLTKPTRSSMLLETIIRLIAQSRGSVPQSSLPSSNENTEVKAKSSESPIPVMTPTDTGIHEASDGDRLDILVAEDNEVNQIVMCQILEQTGFTYKMVENGRLALEAYQADKPSLILMDVSMPEMNGQEATKAIRDLEASSSGPRTPIIGVTAHALKGDMEACLDAGMDDYLSKPVSPNGMMEKIDQWIGSSEPESSVA